MTAAKVVPEIELIEETETELESLYRVIIHNDDITPMDFVVHVLLTVFFIPNPAAAHIMLTAHLNNHSHVQTLPKQEAQKRINQAHFLAAMKNYPLHFTMEPE